MSSTSEFLESVRWPPYTFGIASCVGVVYLVQLLAAGSLDPTAAYGWASSFQQRFGAATVVFSWLMHSSHEHIVWNLVVFCLAGWWLEARIDGERYLQGVTIGLGMGANLAALVVLGRSGLGLSGVTAGLVVMVALGAFQRLADRDEVDVLAIGVALVAGLWVAKTVGVLGGVPAGTAVWVHRVGALFGVVWFVVERQWYGFGGRS